MADVFPEIECSICYDVMSYEESKSGFQKCIHYLHSDCLDRWIETFDAKENTKPFCPSCQQKGNFVDTVIRNENGKFSKTSRNINTSCKKEDYAKAEQCTVCLLNWNTKYTVTCIDCSTSVHTYCLKHPIKMGPNISWRCDLCWLKKFLSTNGVIRVPMLAEHQESYNIEKQKCFFTKCQEIFKTKKRIAIIGSGPCGVSAATQLHFRGHSVDVYEKNERCGGLMREGFLTMKTSRLSVDEHFEYLKKLGIRFFCNRYIENAEYRELLRIYDAIIICTGARIIRSYLPDDINDTVGVFSITKFWSFDKALLDELETLNSAGKRVVYITNNKVSESRYISYFEKKCTNLEVIEILPQPKKGPIIDSEHQWPEWPCFIRKDRDTVRINEKLLTGVRSEPIIKRIITRTNSEGQNIFEGLETVDVTWPNSKTSKIFNAKFKERRTSRIIKADLLIVSDGCIEPRTKLAPDFALNYDDSSNIITNTYSTGTEKVFAAGDCCLGESVLSYAVLEGYRVALEVHKYVMRDAKKNYN